MPRIAVIANCQARPVAALCQALVPQTEITGTSIVHLITPSDEAAIVSACVAADFIFAQLVHDTFPFAFVHTKVLRDRYPGKLVVWPNLFFRGQCPDLFYATGEGHKRLLGPLSEYHLAAVLEAWRAGVPVVEAVSCLERGMPSSTSIIAESSLVNLRHRERNTSISISDLIERDWRDHRLFFTFNHPRARLLEACTRRLLNAAGLKSSLPMPPRFGEPLGRIVPPMSAAMQHRFGLRFAGDAEDIQGVPYPATTSRRCGYSLGQLVETFFRAYDDQSQLAHAARLS